MPLMANHYRKPMSFWPVKILLAIKMTMATGYLPQNPNGVGIAIMHGALIKPKSYAKTAAFFADLGYRVWIPNGQFRLSILSVDRIAKEISEMPEQEWILLGHSMGGLTSLEVNSLLK
jgi:alpha-beta hydrolase superfamily lysophospholipase